MAPKAKAIAKGREIPSPQELPEGWFCVEKMYMTGKHQGETYVRFSTRDGRHNCLLSVKAAIMQQAIDEGRDGDEAIAAYEATKKAQASAQQKEREEKGHLKGEKRIAAVETFRSVYGKLDGATIMSLPGWRGESKLLENCGQIIVRYYSPDGERYSLVVDIEALFGHMMQSDQEIPDIELARQTLQRDEAGRIVNVARTAESRVEELTVMATKRSKKRKYLMVSSDDYNECPDLEVISFKANDQAKLKSRQDATPFLASSSKVQDILTSRGFAKDAELLLVVCGKSTEKLATLLTGIYFMKPGVFNSKSCYQQVAVSDSLPQSLRCSDLHIFWSDVKSCWKIGSLSDDKAAWSFCPSEDGKGITELAKGSWLLLDSPHMSIE